MKNFRLIIFLLLSPIFGLAQVTAGHYIGVAQNPQGQGIPSPTVLVCLEPAVGSPCSTAGVSLYADVGLTVPLSNPFTGDTVGNMSFFADTSKWYHLQISGASSASYDVSYVGLLNNGSGGGGSGNVQTG